ncbi:hemerythrin [Lacihabitans sp. CCS-44]|uniref:hemerythrin n=1 Tax=Lacihabitans sp. CCS-44 TaxID=2487331 RepID=UPI0020CBBDAE|nr:hemerythrin [Lacihabitans sp. CCS-44]MCP9756099.1 hemerythrin [Lacihabitans sp. CCS-44]
MDAKTLENLVETNKMYQLVTERLEVIDPAAQDIYTRFNMESELMELILELYHNDEEEFQYQKLHKFSIEQVLSYLQASHKFYLSKKLPEIEQTMMHIFNKYGHTHQILASLTSFFNDYKNRLIEHIRMEEKTFFPYIKSLIMASKGEMSSKEVDELLNNCSIASFDDNHDPIEDDLKSVSSIIHSYSANVETPLPYRVFLNQVELFEMELRKHAIIEDHVLVPMAREIELRLKQAL